MSSPTESPSAFAVYSGLTGKLSKKQRWRRNNKEKQNSAISVEKSDESLTKINETKKKRKNEDINMKRMQTKKKQKLHSKEKIETEYVPQINLFDTKRNNKKIKNLNRNKKKPEISNEFFMARNISQFEIITEDQVKQQLIGKNKMHEKKNRIKNELKEIGDEMSEENKEMDEELKESANEPTTSAREYSNDCNINNENPPILIPIEQSKKKRINKRKWHAKNNIQENLTPVENQKIFYGLRDSSDIGQEEFAKLIAPFDCNLFFKQHWEKHPLYIPSGADNKFSDLMSTESIDTYLRNQVVMFGKHIDVTSYKNGIRETHNLEGRAVPHIVWDLYIHKCSVRLLCPQAAFENIFLMNSKLQEYFGCFVGANAYLTPPNSQGFAPHYDDIEAFVLQVEGSKKWRIYKPRSKNEMLPRYSSKNFNSSDLDLNKPYMEVTLTPGDLLYFPRGYIHQAEATDSHSLHLTVSVYQKNAWIDLLEKILPLALSNAAENDIEFRRGLPLNYLKQAGLAYNPGNMRRMLVKSVKERIKKLTKYIDIDNAVDMMGAQFVQDALPPMLSEDEKSRCVIGNGLKMKEDGQLKGSIDFTQNTRIRFITAFCQRLVRETVKSENGTEQEEIRLYYSLDNSCEYHGEEPQFLVIPEEYVAAIRLLTANYPAFTALESLPLETLEDQAHLVGDLWDRGLLMTDEPLEENDIIVTEDEEEGTDNERNDSSMIYEQCDMDSEDFKKDKNSSIEELELTNEQEVSSSNPGEEEISFAENDEDDQQIDNYEKAIYDNEKFIVDYEDLDNDDENEVNDSDSTTSNCSDHSEEVETMDQTFVEVSDSEEEEEVDVEEM